MPNKLDNSEAKDENAVWHWTLTAGVEWISCPGNSVYVCMPIDVAKKLREISHHISTTGVLDSEAGK